MISNDGKRLVSGSLDNTIKLWDLPSGKLVQTFTGPALAVGTTLARNLSLSADGKRLAASIVGDVQIESFLTVWDLDTGTKLWSRSLPYLSHVTSVLSPSGKRLFHCDHGGQIVVVDIDSKRDVGHLSGHTKTVSNMVLSGNGKRLVSYAHDRCLKVWDVESETETLSIRYTPDSTQIVSLAVSWDGRRLFTADSNESVVKVWDLDSGERNPRT